MNNNYKLRLFTRPRNVGCGWKMFPAWRQHEGMTPREIFVWYYPDCTPFIDSLLDQKQGTKEKPLQLGGFFECYVGEEEHDKENHENDQCD
jgi:hypothetical protein